MMNARGAYLPFTNTGSLKMRSAKNLLNCILLMIGSLSVYSLADEATETVDFINEATAKGLAEIETGRMALDKSTAPDVKAFAQQMIDDHTHANHMLADIARQKNLDV